MLLASWTHWCEFYWTPWIQIKSTVACPHWYLLVHVKICLWTINHSLRVSCSWWSSHCGFDDSSVYWRISPVKKESNVPDIQFLCYEICCFYLTMNTTHLRHLSLNECGIFYPWVASQKTHHTKQKLSEMSPKNTSIRRQRCYLRPPAAAAALCGMPAFASDVTSSLHRV